MEKVTTLRLLPSSRLDQKDVLVGNSRGVGFCVLSKTAQTVSVIDGDHVVLGRKDIEKMADYSFSVFL